MKKLTVTLDTNVFISGILVDHGIPFTIIEYLRRGAFRLISSQELNDEIIEVLNRAKMTKKYGISVESVRAIGTLLQQKGKLVVPVHRSPEIPIRDPKDLFIVETALTGQADFLVSGDKDILSLQTHASIQPLSIITPKQFVDLLFGSNS